ncbi:4-(cytidine 5'-diphospho)-2-C-methyl-D-erythritol kinase [Tropicibacter naphthalenivorans]|uniref:4-diphosphocytidyl-2-C-methyl-D-erythritol kinase n=1 Tax=Tropicibacter naphthalenivorans TaxID=441103 RepID=A0A0P1GF49_9RHOB|nr:4-(cytidine 5'-diphospho)-2-C-methyl-D-erythritol kinase [Tropicibacter naphthalenivorans]CUH75112.1 4-diphosphocytidyl-2-C-methyl-D-erythritol kinase [Tropicibacter naphthalenivorans]SMC46633.1 4-diphosphocytidyl-2-C-methyl-D-erythritol kinase [Tropicibacter naphthalenivorans]
MPRIKVRAPAKINLALHVTGQRDDGYHLLDSLVVFAPVHDVLYLVTPANGLSLTVEGPEAAGVPADMSNLALRAAQGLTDAVAVSLEKNLPSAAGVGGGSADAAAVIRALMLCDPAFDGLEPRARETAMMARLAQAKGLEALGADVPMCLPNVPQRVRGIGEDSEVVGLPPVPAVLVNPRVPVSTPKVFKAMTKRDNPGLPDLPKLPDAAALIDYLHGTRNDMQEAAIALEPAIAEVLEAIGAQPGCGLARMSGSGATCFGLFADETKAQAAAEALHKAHPDWWIAGGVLGSQFNLGLPEVS